MIMKVLEESFIINISFKTELLGKLSINKAVNEAEDNLIKYACLSSYAYYKCADKITEQLKSENMYELLKL